MVFQVEVLCMDEVWDGFVVARTIGAFAIAVILVGAALETMQSGDFDVLADFIILVVGAMLLIAALAWAWSWFEAASGSR